MFSHGDQYRDTPATTNPFVERTTHVTDYTAQEIATLQSRLEKQLGPEYISTRPGNGGGKVHYLAAEKVINLANEVFGFNGWSSAIQTVQIDFVDENPTNGKINLGLSTIVRVTLKDGTYHEDIGYGHCENTKGKAAAFEKAKKEAATDALKRALRNFGNVLGNCLYDKDYLQKVTRLKIAPSKWDAENLHRHPDYAPIKREAIGEQNITREEGRASKRNISAQSAESGASFGSADFEDDFGGQFDEADFSHPDEVHLDDVRGNTTGSPAQKATTDHTDNEQQRTVPRMQSMPQLRPPGNPPLGSIQRVPSPQRQPTNNGQKPHHTVQPQTPSNPQQASHGVQPQPNTERSRSTATVIESSAQQWQSDGAVGVAPKSDQLDEHGLPLPRLPPPGIPEGFVTGRKAELLNQPPDQRPPNVSLAFDPHAESPSIRRTLGVNPGKSAPVSRQLLTGSNTPGGQNQMPPLALPSGGNGGRDTPPGIGSNNNQRPSGVNFVNPSADPNRRVGMPPANPQSMQNRGAYRPPTAVKRSALADVSNLQQIDGASDPKKAKTEAASPVEVGEQNVPQDQKDAAAQS